MSGMLSRKQLLGVISGIALATVILVSVLLAAYLMASTNAGINDGYALLGAGDMVVKHLKQNNGEWPASWSDLEPQFEKTNGLVGGWSYSRFQGRICIDFDADSEDLRRMSLESPDAHFRVIWAKYESGVRVGADPNQMLCDFFRQGEAGSQGETGQHENEGKSDERQGGESEEPGSSR